jgi:hypothetical protein
MPEYAAAARGTPAATASERVAEEAAVVAAAWSPPGAPASWRLTAAQFEALRDDPQLRALAATIPPDRLPPLLFQAAATALVLELEPAPLRASYPRLGRPQPPLDPAFATRFREFCLDHRDRLLELCARHRYQMNEVGRSAGVVPALPSGRDIALVDLGTGAGLGLHLDRYGYRYRTRSAGDLAAGDPRSALVIELDLRGSVVPPLRALPRIAERIGIDTEPLDLSDADVRAWLAACIPQEIGAVTRFHEAVAIARADPAPTVRGDLVEALPGVLAEIDPDTLVCLVDSFVHVFLPPDELRRFRDVVDGVGAQRDLDWISIDPLVPMGPQATSSVLGMPVPPGLLERGGREGVFGLIGRLRYRGGRREGALLGLVHPGAAWLEWLPPDQQPE